MIYFVQATSSEGNCRGPVKIGFTASTDCSRRVSELQTGHPEKLTLIETREGTVEDEKAWHRLFRDDRLKGEWFRPERIVAVLAALRDLDEPVKSYLLVRASSGQPYYEVKFTWRRRQVKRRIGPAWLEKDEVGEWIVRPGPVESGYFDRVEAKVRGDEIIRQYTFSPAAEKPRRPIKIPEDVLSRSKRRTGQSDLDH